MKPSMHVLSENKQTAIPHMASTGPEQGFPCVVFPHRENPVFIAGFPVDENRIFPVGNTTQGKPCFHYRDVFAVLYYMLNNDFVWNALGFKKLYLIICQATLPFFSSFSGLLIILFIPFSFKYLLFLFIINKLNRQLQDFRPTGLVWQARFMATHCFSQN